MFWYGALLPIAGSVIFSLMAGYFIVRQSRWTNRLKVWAREGEMFRDMINLLEGRCPAHATDEGARMIYANDAVRLHFGVSREELLTWRPDNWDPHFDASSVEALFLPRESGDSLVFETEHRVASGELVPVELRCLCPVRDGVRRTICYARDIRASKAEEARRLESERNETEQVGLLRLSRFMDNTPGCFFTVIERPDGSVAIPFASRGIQGIFGLRPEVVQDDISQLVAVIDPSDQAANLPAMAESARTLSPFHVEFRVSHPEKGELWVEARGRPQRESDGSVLWHGFVQDITERKHLEEQLQRSEQNFRRLLENLPDALFRYDRDCRRTYVSRAVERITGKKTEELMGQTPNDVPLTVGAENEQLVRNIRQVFDTGQAIVAEVEYLAPDGRMRYFQNHFGPERTVDGNVVGVLSIVRDVTECKRLGELLRKREQEFRALVENSPDTIARYDRDCRRVYANPALVARMGANPAQILGRTPAELPGGATGAEYQQMIRAVLMQGKEQSFELRWQTGTLETCTHVRISPEFDADGQVEHVLAFGRDITEIDQYRKRIHDQAFFDALTGLPNRTLLSDRIQQVIADAAYHGHQFGLMMLDLDNFKEINDIMGHGVGDVLLCMVAKRLLACVRSYDTVARLGGDEFLLLLPDMHQGDDLATIAGKILHELAEPFAIGGREFFVTCSVGIVVYPGDSTEIDALYKYADSAMYHAKNIGRNNFQFYQPEFTVRSQERMEIETDLRKAQKRGELALYYQPQIALQSGRMVSAEALLRWQRPGYGSVAPDRFIPIAEASGLILGIGEWVLSTACRDAARWNRERAIPVRVAVNLSTRQFIRNDLVGTIRRILEETGCAAAWLELEITESLLLEDSSEVSAMLAALHGMGLSISIDDFGTGYSALSYLSRFPVSQIKIDRSFINEIPTQKDKSELVKAMLSIATALHLESVAEGVETIGQAAYLKTQGCQLAQGYLFGKPMPLREFEAVLARADTSAADEAALADDGANQNTLI